MPSEPSPPINVSHSGSSLIFHTRAAPMTPLAKGDQHRAAPSVSNQERLHAALAPNCALRLPRIRQID